MKLPEPPSLASVKSMADQAVGFRDAIKNQSQANLKEIQRLEEEEHLLALCGQLLRTLADEEVSEGVEAVTQLQTEGLQEIFPDKDLSLEAEVSESRGKVSVELVTVDKKPDGTVIKDSSIEAFGGSVTTVESILLRLIVIMRRDLRPLLVLDETLAAVARSYVGSVAEFFRAMCEKIPGGMDILAVSHDPQLIEGAQRAYVIEASRSGAVTFKEKRE